MIAVDAEFAIIGGGVAGLSMAIALRSLGKDYLLFEQAAKLRGVGAGFGLAANAMQAFEYLGLREVVEKVGYYTESFDIFDDQGRVLLAPDTDRLGQQFNQKNFTVHRADLHALLLKKVPVERMHLNKRVVRFDRENQQITLHFSDNTTYRCRYLLIADGVKSPLRQQLLPKATPRYAGYTCWRATIDNLDLRVKHGSETWGPQGRFGLTPLVGDRLYWYACINAPAKSEKFKRYTPEDLLTHFEHYHDPIPSALQKTPVEALLWNDIIDIRPLSRFAFGPVLLMGDAAHATTPNLGQGACQALEDVAVLTELLQKENDVELAFRRFEKRRLSRTRYITETSWRIGKISQWTNPALITLRNLAMRHVPSQWVQSPINRLLKQNF